MAQASRDQNFVTTLLAVSSVDGVTPVTLYADPVTHRLLTDISGAGTGTVTSVSVTTANGVSGTVATATTTPAITITLGAITPSSVTVSGLTASQIVATDASKVLVSLAVATYPSLTELTYLKGVTSALQTQIDAKGVGDMVLASVQTVTGAKTFGSAGAVGKLIIAGATSGTTILDATAVAGAGTVTLPTTGTLATLAGVEAFTNKTLTSPKILTDISDTNGNELVSFTTTGSAVNQVKITNAATGTAGPTINVEGETNVDLKIGAKGTGKVAMQTQVNFGAFTAYFTETDNGNSSTADTIDWTLSNKQKSTLTGNCTFTFTAPPGPCNLILKLAQDGTGSRTVIWPAAVHWSGGTAPTLTTTVSKIDMISFYWDGTTYFGQSALNFTA